MSGRGGPVDYAAWGAEDAEEEEVQALAAAKELHEGNLPSLQRHQRR